MKFRQQNDVQVYNPWTEPAKKKPTEGPGTFLAELEAEHGPVPLPGDPHIGGQTYLDISRLVLQCVVVALLTGAGIYTLRVKGK